MFFVYILISESKGRRFYVGLSGDVEKRLGEHNARRTRSTKAYVPWKLFFFEKFETRTEAREREKYYKSGSGKELIKEKWFRSSTG